MRVLALLAGLVLAGCSRPHAPPPEERQQHRRPGIVSLNPCSDAVLAQVADPAQILALSHYSRDPASSSMDVEKARRFASVAGTVEEVLALDPDLVIAGSFLPPATAAAFADFGIPVLTMPIATSVDDSREHVLKLARAAGHPERGHALNARIKAALDNAAPPAGEAARTAIVWQAGGIVPGPDTLIADLLARTGFSQLSAARGMGQAEYLPLEAMLADPPDVIFAAGNSRLNENRLLSHPALAGLADTRRAAFDPSLLWCGGPTIIAAAKRLAHVRKGM